VTKRTVNKAARLVLLHLLREGGALPSEANQSDVARLLNVNRSTITRDLRELDAGVIRVTLKFQPWTSAILRTVIQ
jgi:Mn-dependent DtxR family transcriptional regulator